MPKRSRKGCERRNKDEGCRKDQVRHAEEDKRVRDANKIKKGMQEKKKG